MLFRYYSRAIYAYFEPYLGRFRHIQNPGLFRHVMVHAYSGIFSTLEYVIKQCFMQKKNFQTWNKKRLICVILGFKFEKLLSYFKLAALN